MLNAKTGTSTKKDAGLAGKEAAQQVKEIADNMKLAFVYSGVQYDQKTLLNAISAELPGIPLIGNTSFTAVSYTHLFPRISHILFKTPLRQFLQQARLEL